ncbi:VOC family protein [Actinomyces capricornis]|uniref:VOC family protein n=1 Tax=Actinomyces capricornis TaxID=2755559 RepID=A0ABN6K3M3_9ACTO|nr:VOC family protein [Actinomyces capricornis]BDA64202.1 VOC family protein [Actinomyces capricornis]
MRADLSAYISFGGRAREALEYYQQSLGGQVVIETFRTWGIPTAPGHEDDVVYGVLRTDNGFVIRARDHRFEGTSHSHLHPGGEQSAGWALCLNGEEAERLADCWASLARRASIIEPLETAPWGDCNGVLIDPFGIRWVVNIGDSE